MIDLNKMSYVDREIYDSYRLVSIILNTNIETAMPNEFTEEELNAFKIVKDRLDTRCKEIEKEYCGL